VVKLIKLLLEQYRYKRAMRNLSKLEWSTDFLVFLLRRAQIKGLALRITNRDLKTQKEQVLEISVDSPAHVDFMRGEMKMNQDEWDAMLGLGGVK